MLKIQTRNKISPVGLEQFGRNEYEVASEIPNPDALLLRSYKLPTNEIRDSVRAIARAGAGVNNIPVDYCTDKGIVVFNTPGANANSVKELVIAGLLLSSRRIHEGMSWVEKQDADNDLAKNVEKEKSNFAGTEISGKKLGVVGLGAIGVLVANAAVELGMEVYGHDPFISVNAAWGLSSKVNRCDSLNQLMGICDYITLHVPLTPDTENLVNTERLKRANNGLRILNFSRGGLVDSAGVKKALIDGVLSRYVTDFPEPELLGIEGVMSIPHLGASTEEAEDNCAIMAGRQLKDYLENGNITNSVNFPSCSLEPSGGVRLLVANRNVPNMLSQILAVLADENLNVEDMVNRHRDGIAYNIIDLSAACISVSAMSQLSGIEGVVMIRQICR
ncbi:MAG: 3-phosphoglycerate dehydrogenase family protein [Spirochaetaceae bacterium]|nr:3-phosphoglycerate dehydrogenase family protein [Spirochaetaceae bacterium]